MSGISYIVAVFLAQSVWPYGAASQAAFGSIRYVEAVIAVLLLVPGFSIHPSHIARSTFCVGSSPGHPKVRSARLYILHGDALGRDRSGKKGWIVQVAFIAAALLPLCASILLVRRRPYRTEVALTDRCAEVGYWQEASQAPSSGTRRPVSSWGPDDKPEREHRLDVTNE